MKMRGWISAGLLVAVAGLTGRAADVSSFRVSDALLNTENPSKWSVGFYGYMIQRDVDVDNLGVRTLKAKQGMMGVGYDILPWLTASLGLGATDGKLDGLSDYDKFRLSWSAGLNANLWTIEAAPVRITFKGLGEFSQHRVSNSEGLDWIEFLGAGTVNLELFAEDDVAEVADIVSMVLYAGPAFSVISGNFDNGVQKRSFSEDQTFGVVAGVDLYLTQTVALGANVQYFDAPTWGGSFRYHF